MNRIFTLWRIPTYKLRLLDRKDIPAIMPRFGAMRFIKSPFFLLSPNSCV